MFSFKSFIIKNQKAFLICFGYLLFCTISTFADVSTWEGSLKSINSNAWGTYIKPAVQIGLFIWFAIKLIMILVQRDKEHNWWEMLMLLMAVIICQFVGDIFKTITGTSALN